MAPILTVTLNPALDLTTSVDRLEADLKLRCAAPTSDPGGGGANVSRAIRELGGRTCAFILAGGPTGRRYAELLRDEGVEVIVRPCAGDTRTTFQVRERETGRLYRFVLPGPDASGEEAGVFAALSEAIETHRPEFLVASGSLPPGVSVGFYKDLSILARDRGVRFILDCTGPALKAALQGRPFLVRANRNEAMALAGLADLDASAALALARRLTVEAAVPASAFTLGADGAVVWRDGRAWRITPPRVETVSLAGAGDSFVAGLTLALARGWSMDGAGRLAAAAAASAATTPATRLCRRDQTEALFAETAAAEMAIESQT